MTRIIAISNEKGGVAKTTTAISLGGALVEMKEEVLLVDLDPQANLTLALGITPKSVRRSISDVIFNAVSPISVSIETQIPGLDLIASNADMVMAERFLPTMRHYKYKLRDTLINLKHYNR